MNLFSNNFPHLWITIGFIIGLGGLIFGLVYRALPMLHRLKDEIRLICTSGHLPPPPTETGRRILKLASRGAVWLQVGRVTISGHEYLECDTPRIITPNHGHYLDPFVMALILNGRARCIAALGLFQFGGGLGALIFSRWGAFCTDLSKGRGGAALKSAVRVVASGETLLMFPEGWANMDGLVRSFKPGAVQIARLAAVKVGAPITIVPVHLSYGAYPGAWVMRFPTSIQCLVMLSGLLFFRKGVHVTIGKPLLSSELPENTIAATEELRRAIIDLSPASTT